MKKLLVTGLSGFVGQTISQVLGKRSHPGLVLASPECEFDVTDAKEVLGVIERSKPDYVIHLAAQSFVPESFSNPKTTYDVNFFGTFRLLEALKSANFPGRLLFIGSAQVYGLVDASDMPIKETYPLKPRNPYAVSKLAGEALCYQWSQTEKIDIVMARPFNHIGPGQSERFVVSDFAKQIAEIKLGKKEPVIRVGDIEVTRDFADVRDVVNAYFLLLEHGINGEVYNVCSGVEYNIREVLDQLQHIGGVRLQVNHEGNRSRPSEQRRFVGDFSKLNRCTGWKPEIPFDKSLTDVLNYWERKLGDD